MSPGGILEKIWLKRSKGGPMDPVETAVLVAGHGLAENADRRRKRQVTILEREEWERVTRGLGIDADPSRRRANLLVRNFPLRDSRGRILQIGPCHILIHGETKPCYQMDDVSNGLRTRMWADWAGGAYGEVVAGGEIRSGDAIRWVEALEPAETLPGSES